MKAVVRDVAATLHARADAAWRDPAAAAVQWSDAAAVDERLLRHTVHGAFWETLAAHRLTLLVTREYEHLVIGLHAGKRSPVVSYLPVPHPSGLVADVRRGVVHVASTRKFGSEVVWRHNAQSGACACGRRRMKVPLRVLVLE
jgi:hypothetical protein